MKRVDGLIEFSRRDFCAFACVGAAATLVACIGTGSQAVQTGGLDGSDNGAMPDAPRSGSGSNVVPHPDGGTGQNPDAGVAATCSGAYTDVGTPASYTLGVPKYVSSIAMFVVKDSMGFYAMTSRCTHQGVQLNNYASGTFHCSAHGADFDINGAVLDGPTSKPLAHYAMCTLANGNLGVETTVKVAASARLVA